MRKGWQTKPIGDVFRVVNGGTPKTGTPAYWDGDHAWITPAEMGNLDTPFISASRRTLTDEGLRTGAELVPVGSVILSSRAPIGHLVINEIPMAFNQGCKGLIPSPEIDAKFAYYFLLANVPLLESLGTGATFKELSGGKLKEVLFHFPALDAQHRIVTLLDEAFADIATAKANAEKNLLNARELFESHLQSVFMQRGDGWKVKRIEEWCESIIDCVNKTAPLVEGPTPFKMIRTTNVRNGQVDISAVRFVTEATYKLWTRRLIPRKGDVILTREAPMGEVGMLLTDDMVFLGQRLVSYRVNPNFLDNHFLLLALQSRDLQGQIHAKASGSTVQHMRVPDTKNLLLAAPSLKQQREVVTRLTNLREETRCLESIYRQKLTALDDLKKSLLHQAFSGQL